MTETARKPARIAVMGGGAWGTALAQLQCGAGNTTWLWARDQAMVDTINTSHQNSKYLPGVVLDDALLATTDAAEALDGADFALVAIPTQSLRAALEKIEPMVATDTTLVLCAKGIERSRGNLPTEVACQVVPGRPVAALSGPSFAMEVSRGLPTAVTVAAGDSQSARRLSAALSTTTFRCYSTDDLVGVELGGALKNVLAIAAGIVVGRDLGSSAQAALITRGFVELRRIGTAYGARPETLMGLSGLGDLILTCSSDKSRNFAYGLALGRGESVENRPLAEGVFTAAIAAEIARARKIEAPIIAAVDRILDGSIAIADAIDSLLHRPLKSED